MKSTYLKEADKHINIIRNLNKKIESLEIEKNNDRRIEFFLDDNHCEMEGVLKYKVINLIVEDLKEQKQIRIEELKKNGVEYEE